MRREQFDGDLRRFLFDLKSVTPVVVTGDFKVAHEGRDFDYAFHPHRERRSPRDIERYNVKNPLWPRPGELIDNEGEPVEGPIKPAPYSYIPLQVDFELRRRFSGYLMDGFYDALRLFDTRGEIYTCWPVRRGIPGPNDVATKRQLNIGWRTDYFLLSPALKDWARNSTVLKYVMGSRNAPIKLVLDLPDPDNPPPPPPPEPEVDYQPDLGFDPTYTGGDPSNPYFVPAGE